MNSLDPINGRRLERPLDDLCAEFAGQIAREQIEDLLRGSARQLASTATIINFIPVLAYRRTREQLRAITRAAAANAATWDVVFVSCSRGARSQIATALTTHLSSNRVRTHAAGTAVNNAVGPNVRAVLAEIRVDPEAATAPPATVEVLRTANVIVTMGNRVVVAPSQSVTHEDWRVADPVGAPLAHVRETRANIEHRVRVLLAELGCPQPARKAAIPHAADLARISR